MGNRLLRGGYDGQNIEIIVPKPAGTILCPACKAECTEEDWETNVTILPMWDGNKEVYRFIMRCTFCANGYIVKTRTTTS